jgi:hypothetical protein
MKTDRKLRVDESKAVKRPLLGSLPWHLKGKRWAAVREVHLGRGCGNVDLLVVTDAGEVAIVEAKLRRNKDAKDKVLGQLLAYLAHYAYRSADTVLERILAAADSKKNRAEGCWNGKPRRAGEPTVAEVREWLEESRRSGGLTGVVAVDTWQDGRDDRRLGLAVRYVAEHGIPVRIMNANGELIESPSALEPLMTSRERKAATRRRRARKGKSP